MTTSKVGSLLRISGQVVRTHPVHPELIAGTFMCLECQNMIKDIEQQFKFSQVRIFMGPNLKDKSKKKFTFANFPLIEGMQSLAFPAASISMMSIYMPPLYNVNIP